jgi:SulP family sulfate permease
VVVVVVCLVATGALAHLPMAALAAVVLVIGIDLIDVAGLRRIFTVRRPEFAVAVLTAAAVVVLGVEQGIVLAVVASIVDHLRHSYAPHNAVLAKSAAGHWQSLPVTAGARTTDGLLVYRFGSGLYFANAARLGADIGLLTSTGPVLQWFCLDAAAIGDIDYSAAAVLATVTERLHAEGVRVVVSNAGPIVHTELQRYGLTPDHWYDTSGEVLADYETETTHG